jgi:hypothetical protein
MTNKEKITTIIRHNKKVEDNCNTLANKLESENFDFALKLIQRGRIHDASKFDDYEFKYYDLLLNITVFPGVTLNQDNKVDI